MMNKTTKENPIDPAKQSPSSILQIDTALPSSISAVPIFLNSAPVFPSTKDNVRLS